MRQFASYEGALVHRNRRLQNNLFVQTPCHFRLLPLIIHAVLSRRYGSQVGP